MRILARYVLREILPPFLLSLLIFTFILTLPPVMKELERLVAKGVTWDVAFRILLTLVPQGLGLTIPMATLTGILVGLGRMSGDRETVALLACGVSPYRLLKPIMAFAAVMAGATAYVMFYAIPDANQAFRNITWEIISTKVENDISPRVFFEDFPGYVLYIKDVDQDGTWRDVMVADTTKPEQPSVILAARGRIFLDKEARRVDLVLENGTRYKHPGELKFAGVSVDPQTGSFSLRAVVPNPDRILLPGMFVRAVLERGERADAVLAPQRAITRDPKGNGLSE